ncbi:hypothetical protein AAG906_038532 [Vitis piasezkii]
MNSPFFLGTGDRPGDFITPTRLRGDNYDDWASDIQLALEARRKFEFLEGTITGPQPPYTQSDWNTVNAMLVSWTTNTIDLEVKTTEIYVITTYYGKLNVLWEELFKHEPLISCNCCSSCLAHHCTTQKREQGKLHDFLMGLNTIMYAQLRTNILSQDPLPSLDRAYPLVIQDERVRLAKAVTEDKPTEVLGFARPVCSHCKKTGHETSTCWSLVACPHCHKHGHDKNNCYEIVGYPEGWLDQNKADGGLGRSRQLVVGVVQLVLTASSIVGASSTKVLPINSSHRTMESSCGLNCLTRSHGSLTRATHHVTGDLSWLFDTITLFECPIGLPNGESLLRPNPVPFICRITSLLKPSTLELWHKRMGHPSEKVVKLLPPDVFPFGNPVCEYYSENIVPTVNVEIDSDFADFSQTQNPEASSPLSPGGSCSPVGLDSLGLDNTSNGRSAPMGKGMRINFLRFYYEILLLIRWF